MIFNDLPDPTGNNSQRIADPELDQALATAGGTLDDHARMVAYVTAMQRINADAGEIPLYARLDLNAHSTAVQNFQTNGNDFLSWNAQDWWLNQ